MTSAPYPISLKHLDRAFIVDIDETFPDRTQHKIYI